VKDCEWLAELLQHGLLRASFIPPQPIRELRDLTRHRSQLLAEKARASNRIQKVLEEANIKLGSVATDVLGASGQDMLEALIRGESEPDVLAQLARKRLRSKIPALRRALEGRVTDHHRFLLRLHLDHVRQLDELVARFNARIDAALAPFNDQVERLKTIPGISDRVAQTIVAELGVDMGQFPDAQHVASWAGMCSGNNESAGKRRSGRTTKGNGWLRTMLVQAAWAASHTKNTYVAAQFRRLAARRGRKRALIAVGHTLLIMIYNVLKKQQPYCELGSSYFDLLNPHRLTRSLVRRLESLGHKVTLEPVEAA
jgi:transposase